MPWKPQEPGEVPTLGFEVLDWMSTYLAAPDKQDYEPFVLTMEQAQFVINFYAINPYTGRRRYRRGVISRPKGWGKALALDTPIPTPTGWSTMGALDVGDAVFSEKGAVCTVQAVSPVWTDTDCWRVTFSDGEQVVASGDHRWAVEELAREYAPVVVDTRTLAARLTRADGARNFRLPLPGALDCPEVTLPLAPYALGAWLGDGDSDAGRVTVPDEEIIDGIVAGGFPLRSRRGLRASFTGLQAALRRLGVLDDKHVPAAYLRASAEQRLALLCGLMDTDGSVDKAGTCEFTTTSPALHAAVVELLASLGIKSSSYPGRARLHGRDCGPKWRIKFTAYADVPVFRVARKLNRQPPPHVARRLAHTRRVVAVEPVEPVPTRCIEVDSDSHQFLVGRRMVQTHNSPLLSAITCAEALAPVVPAGWDADGRPVGKPWSEVRTVLAQLAAVSEDQTANAWGPLLEMLREGPVLDEYPGLEPMNSFVNLPGKGKIEFVTSASASREGGRPVFCCLDQTETWVTNNGGVRLAATLRRNLGKTGGSSIESPNAFVPGEESVAEVSASYYSAILERRTKDDGLLYDHREAPPETDLFDKTSLLSGLEVAYGESAETAGGWVDLERIVAECWDPATDAQDARRYYLNAITHATDSWISQPAWAAIADPLQVVADDEMIALGFDGSRHRSDAITDATALIGCRISDGFVFPIHVWEQPDTVRDWWAPTAEVDATVRDAFKRWNVVAMYADPAADWRSYVAGWEADFGEKLQCKMSAQHPIEWWMGGMNLTKTVRALEQTRSAIVHKEMTHDGSAVLTRHVLNARRRESRVGFTIAKDFPESPRKIDAAVAMVLAWQARTDAVAKGMLTAPAKSRSRRIMRF